MAEVDTTQLSQEHGAIRHDIAVESARLGSLIGQEACGINKHLGDARRETERGFSDTRYSLGRDINTSSADIRREQAAGFGDTRYSVATEHCKTNDVVRQEGQENVMATKDARYDVATRVGDQADRIVDRVQEHDGKVSDRFFAVSRDLADIRQGQATLAKEVELNNLKSQLEAQKNTQYLSDKIAVDGDKTRTLINDLKYHDLSRGLVERNTELVNCEQERRHYRDRWDDARFNQIQAGFQGQWAQLQSQIQAFQSQLQETRQGMVNFGTMAGVGQTSTSNNVR
jgi:hypothetical protein